MRVVDSDGRAKVYRPLDQDARRDAREAGLVAYAEGRFFEAHELLEPAWMGSADPAERDLDQGLIKLAAAYVHAERGNLLGMRKNLAGAQRRLGAVVHTHGTAGQRAADAAGVDAKSLLARVEGILARVEALLAATGQTAADPLPARFPPPVIPRATTRRRHVAREPSNHA
jgi:predicted metal-dependent hydrolase